MNEVTFECLECKAEGDYEHSCPHCGWSEQQIKLENRL